MIWQLWNSSFLLHCSFQISICQAQPWLFIAHLQISPSKSDQNISIGVQDEEGSLKAQKDMLSSVQTILSKANSNLPETKVLPAISHSAFRAVSSSVCAFQKDSQQIQCMGHLYIIIEKKWWVQGRPAWFSLLKIFIITLETGNGPAIPCEGNSQ